MVGYFQLLFRQDKYKLGVDALMAQQLGVRRKRSNGRPGLLGDPSMDGTCPKLRIVHLLSAGTFSRGKGEELAPDIILIALDKKGTPAVDDHKEGKIAMPDRRFLLFQGQLVHCPAQVGLTVPGKWTFPAIGIPGNTLQGTKIHDGLVEGGWVVLPQQSVGH